MNTTTPQRSLKDFTQTLFDQAAALVPAEIREMFPERFEQRSEFLFAVLLFFYFAKKNLPKSEICKLEIIDGRKTYRMKLKRDDLWIVLTFGNKGGVIVTEKENCAFKIYDNSVQLQLRMAQQEPSFDDILPILIVNGLQDKKSPPNPVYSVIFQRGTYYSDFERQITAVNFITEVLYALNTLRSTTKVFEITAPKSGTQLSASYYQEDTEKSENN